MQLFENISMMLSQHGPLIKKYYSATYPLALSYVISKIKEKSIYKLELLLTPFMI